MTCLASATNRCFGLSPTNACSFFAGSDITHTTLADAQCKTLQVYPNEQDRYQELSYFYH
jgi:hypothetical protein